MSDFDIPASVVLDRVLQEVERLREDNKVLREAAALWERLVRKGNTDYEPWPPGSPDLYEQVTAILAPDEASTPAP